MADRATVDTRAPLPSEIRKRQREVLADKENHQDEDDSREDPVRIVCSAENSCSCREEKKSLTDIRIRQPRKRDEPARLRARTWDDGRLLFSRQLLAKK